MTVSVPVVGARSSPRCGASTSAGCRCCCSTPTGRRTTWPTAGSRRGCTSAIPRCGCGSTRCSASAASARSARSAWSRAWSTSTRATPRSPAWSSRGRRPARRLRRRGAGRSARAHGLHHPHAGPRRQRHLSGRPDRGRAHAPRGRLGMELDALVRRGRTHPDEAAEPFGVTQFALRASRAANGVSARHGEVAREMWHDLWPDRAVADVPIGHVTNGVHIPTWIGGPMRELLDRQLGAGWVDRATDPETWAPVDTLPAEELWAARAAQRRELIELVRERSVTDRLGRGDTLEYVRAAAEGLDPDALTLGFARRVATYKRLDLLLSAVDRALSLLGDADRPVQMILAGKAHPRDDEGKRLVQRLFELKAHPEVARRVVYLDDYDFRLGAALTRGCDVWVNVPRPPLEASGTSGMKSAINAGLQLGVLDGWWPEAYDGRERLGDQWRGRPRPRGAGLAPRRRALPADQRGGDPDLLRPRRRRPAAGLAARGALLAAHLRPEVRGGAHARGLRGAHLPSAVVQARGELSRRGARAARPPRGARVAVEGRANPRLRLLRLTAHERRHPHRSPIRPSQSVAADASSCVKAIGLDRRRRRVPLPRAAPRTRRRRRSGRTAGRPGGPAAAWRPLRDRVDQHADEARLLRHVPHRQRERPPGPSTRASSATACSARPRCISRKLASAASNVASANGSASASPWRSSRGAAVREREHGGGDVDPPTEAPRPRPGGDVAGTGGDVEHAGPADAGGVEQRLGGARGEVAKKGRSRRMRFQPAPRTVERSVDRRSRWGAG